jgi:hypothetical protein
LVRTLPCHGVHLLAQITSTVGQRHAKASAATRLRSSRHRGSRETKMTSALAAEVGLFWLKTGPKMDLRWTMNTTVVCLHRNKTTCN